MYKIYLDNILQADGDIYDFNTAFDITIIREDGFSNDEQVLREKSEVEIKMCGGAYAYIVGKMQDDLCSEILVTIVDESCALIYNGQIKANTIKTYPKTKTATAKIFDMLFSADLRDVIDTDTQTYLRRTKNCGYIEIEPIVISMNLDPDTIATRADVQCYDALSLLDYIVKYHTDGTSYVYSDFLTNTKFAITTGFNMHDFGAAVEEIYPTVSFNQVFEEIRKKERIYMEVQRDDTGVYFIRVEHEDFFFEDSMLFGIDGIPEGTTQEYDTKRNFSSIEVGSNETDLEDTSIVYYPQDELTAWNEEVYKFCGTCAADKDSKLDLINEFIIDSNLIYEAVNAGNAEYAKDSNLFMFRYETNEAGAVPILDLDADSNTYVYNLDINNEQTLNKWVDYVGKCIQRSRMPEYYFRASYIPNSMLSVPTIPPLSGTSNTLSSVIPYNNIINANRIISSNYFLCTENGEYNFRFLLKDIIYAGTTMTHS